MEGAEYMISEGYALVTLYMWFVSNAVFLLGMIIYVFLRQEKQESPAKEISKKKKKMIDYKN